MTKSAIVRYTLAGAILALVAGAGLGCEEKKSAPAPAKTEAPAKAPEKK